MPRISDQLIRGASPRQVSKTRDELVLALLNVEPEINQNEFSARRPRRSSRLFIGPRLGA
jgi:hypothetical protein